MSTAPITLDFSKAQKIKPEEGVQLDFSKAQRVNSGQDTAAPEQPGLLSQVGSAAANQLGIPASPQDVSEAGSALGSDLWGMAKGLPKMAVGMSPPGMAYRGLQKAKEQYNALRTGQPTPEQQHAEEQKAAGHGWYYRNIATPAAEGIGVNVPGMEESAKKGSIGGVIGHAAAVPVAMAITEGAARGVPALREAFPSNETRLARAKSGFDLMNREIKEPIDVTVPRSRLDEAARVTETGGGSPSVSMRKFGQRVPPFPNRPELPFRDLRDFASNASRLSAKESAELKPQMHRQNALFAKDLNETARNAAQKYGYGDVYERSMRDYSRAIRSMDRNAAIKELAKKYGTKIALTTAIGGPAAAAGMGIYHMFSK